MIDIPGLKTFWAEHASRVAAHENAGKPMVRGIFADCSGTIINNAGFIEEDIIGFLRDARREKEMTPHVISADIGGSRLIFSLNDVDIDDLPTQAKQDLAKEMARTGAKLELLIDDDPAEKTLPAVTLIHPRQLLSALKM